jgi:hypothetical protein
MVSYRHRTSGRGLNSSGHRRTVPTRHRDLGFHEGRGIQTAVPWSYSWKGYDEIPVSERRTLSHYETILRIHQLNSSQQSSNNV